MGLNAYRDEAGRFLKAIHASSQPAEAKLRMLQEELDILRDISPSDDKEAAHQVYDLLFLLMEIASQYNVDLDHEWEAGQTRKAEKYLFGQ